ncbi:MAG: hypothetical protein AAFZ15_10980 [Bacteroidota bacterium]
MIAHLRKQYNTHFTEKKYEAFLSEIFRKAGHEATFKIAETPIFIPPALKKQLLDASEELVDVICRPGFKEYSQETIFPNEFVPGETPNTHFLSIDFGICADEDGNISPQLIEIQGFPSLFFYQHLCATAYKNHFNLPGHYTYLFNGLTAETYLEKLRQVIVGDSRPENVVLLEVEPYKQNTQIDFYAASKMLGIKICCLSDLKTEGRDVFYLDDDGKKIKVERVFNRVIFDELVKHPHLEKDFSIRKEYDIKWIGHPHWFARISKHTLPLFDSEFVPDSYFLNDEKNLPSDLENYVLKPLYSFSGQGVIINPVPADVEAIPEDKRKHFILQKKVKYARLVETLDDPAKVEVRIMMAWEEGAERPTALTNLVRLSKGEMVGVRYNKGRSWVGGSVGFFE